MENKNTTKEVKVKGREISITKTYDLKKPLEVLQMAKTLKAYVVKENLFANIKGKNYAMVEGWMFAGFLTGLNVIVEEPKDLSNDKEVKWSCTARIYDNKGTLVANGFALCSNKEAIKKGFDEYAIMSMSQTRAIGKAYRNKIGWVMKLAGYEGTPKEEMHKVDEVIKEQIIVAPVKNVDGVDQVPEDHVCAKCGNDLTIQEAQYSKKMFGKELCREHQKEAKAKK